MDDESLKKQMQLKAKQLESNVETKCCDCAFCSVSTKVEATYSCDKGCFDSDGVAPKSCPEFRSKEE